MYVQFPYFFHSLSQSGVRIAHCNKVSKNVYNSTYCFLLKQILVLKREVYFLNMQRSVYCSKGTGSPDDNLLNAYKIKAVPSVHAPTVLKFLGCLVKEKNK
jgi:hypothetical protein